MRAGSPFLSECQNGERKKERKAGSVCLVAVYLRDACCWAASAFSRSRTGESFDDFFFLVGWLPIMACHTMAWPESYSYSKEWSLCVCLKSSPFPHPKCVKLLTTDLARWTVSLSPLPFALWLQWRYCFNKSKSKHNKAFRGRFSVSDWQTVHGSRHSLAWIVGSSSLNFYFDPSIQMLLSS